MRNNSTHKKLLCPSGGTMSITLCLKIRKKLSGLKFNPM